MPSIKPDEAIAHAFRVLHGGPITRTSTGELTTAMHKLYKSGVLDPAPNSDVTPEMKDFGRWIYAMISTRVTFVAMANSIRSKL